MYSNSYKNPIKATFVGCQDVKEDFTTSNCIIGISVGQKAHEGDRLRAMLQLINRHFASCTILVGDVLQRHNMDNFHDKYQAAYRQGDDWLSRNRELISNLTIPCKIERWEKWLNSSAFPTYLKEVQSQYLQDENFYHSIQATIDEFYERVAIRGKIEINKKDFIQNSLVYLLEEIAIINRMLPAEGYQYFIYPNKISPALQTGYDTFVKPFYPDAIKWIHVQLKKK